jgi:hypothetical protein
MFLSEYLSGIMLIFFVAVKSSLTSYAFQNIEYHSAHSPNLYTYNIRSAVNIKGLPYSLYQLNGTNTFWCICI